MVLMLTLTLVLGATMTSASAAAVVGVEASPTEAGARAVARVAELSIMDSAATVPERETVVSSPLQHPPRGELDSQYPPKHHLDV